MSAQVKNKNILYVAPEIPALSATFVYNEIFEMRALGHQVDVVSVHKPGAQATEKIIKKVGDVFYLYQSPIYLRLLSVIKAIFLHPVNFIKAFGLLLSDVISTGIISRNSVGLCFRFLSSCELALYVKKNKIEHIHVHFAHVPTDIVMYAATISNISFSVTSHANDIFERGLLLSQKIKRSKFFATISEFNKLYLNGFTNQAEKLKVVYCGVDKRKFETRKEEPSNKKFTYGLLGRLVEKKGTHILLQAIALLKRNHQDFKLEIVGDGPEKNRLMAIVKKEQLENYVTFLGQMPNDKVPSWLNTLNCFVLPCVKDKNGDMDGIPVSLMEAMLKGIPVISTDISGLPELIIANKTGVTATANSIDSLANALEDIKSMSLIKRNELVQDSLSHVQKKFDLRVNVNQLSNYINSEG
jgi:glycosyltransferase involved in cell wall biosynthesis